MTKTGRNDPCPCGSGKKYKKCCLPNQIPSMPAPVAAPAPRYTLADMADEVEHLDELSNGILHAIKAGQLEEAERLYRQLAEEYPDELDTIERYAMLCEARGDFATAATYYRRTVDFARNEGEFDPELIDLWTRDAERCEALQAQGASGPAVASPSTSEPETEGDLPSGS